MKTTLVAVKMILIIVITVSIGSVLGAIGYVASIKNNPPVAVQPTPIITTPISTMIPTQLLGSNINTSRWNDYKNEKYGFEVKHPQDWIVEEENQRPNNSIAGIQFGEKKEIINTEGQKEEVKKIGFSMYVFKSVKDLPQNTENLSLEKWIKKYYQPLSEGENIKSVIFGAENYQGFLVEKFKDVGVVAIIPKVYVQKDGLIYNIQSEVPTLATSKDFFATDYDYDKVFQQMLFTFKFIGKDDISTWATYRNDKYKYELKYPPKFIILNEETNKDVVHWRESKEFEGGLDIFVEKTKYNSINEIEKSIDDANEAAKKEFGLERYVKLQYITINNIKGIIVSDRNTTGDWNIVSVFAHDGNLFKVGFVNSIENLKQILSTFKFIINDNIADWKTYKNEKYGFEFKYPSLLTVKEKFDEQANLQEVSLISLEGNFTIYITDNKNIVFNNPKGGGEFRYDVKANKWISVSGENADAICWDLRYVISNNIPSYHFGNLMVDGYPRTDLIVTNKGFGLEIWREDISGDSWQIQEKIASTIGLIGNTKLKEVNPCIGFKVTRQ